MQARLLHRSRRRVTPTEVGADYYQQCVLALDTLEEARQQAREGTAQAQGELRLTAPPWCATPHFAQMLADYRLAYPGVTLALQLESRHVDLAARGVDLALRVTAQPEPHLIVRPITAIRFDWVASPAYLARHGQPPDRAALAAHHALLPDYVAIDTPMQRCAESNDALMLYQLALAGMGVALVATIVLAINGVTVCRNGGVGDPRELVDMTGRLVTISIDLKAGGEFVRILTNDLTYAYVEENSAYSS